MSVILTEPGGKIVMAAPGRPMLAAPLPTSVSVGGVLTSVPGLTGWWDAGEAAGIIGPSNAPLTAFGASAGGVADKSGAGVALTVWHQASSGATAPIATGHLNGLLGGLGLNTIVPPNLPQSGQQLPLMDPDQGLISASMNLGSATAWTVFLVWSRPNWRQSNTGPSTLFSIAGTEVLAADNTGGTNRLMLFPGARQTVLTSTLERRHTHAVILRNTPGVGVDVWLGPAQVATSAPNPLASSVTAPLLFLHSGAASGGAECWFTSAQRPQGLESYNISNTYGKILVK